jgi:DHA2 family multidrug resistance protein
VTRRGQFHQSRLVEGLQPLSPPFNDFTQHLGQATQGTGLTITAETYHATLQQASLLGYLDAFRAIALIFLVLLPLLLFVKPGAADASAHAGGH